MKTAYEIIQDEPRLSTRPEFYSGRGAIRGDLNSDILESIYQAIKTHNGDEAAVNFVYLVADMDKLSATAFLNTFYQFGDMFHRLTIQPTTPIDHTDIGPDDGGRLAIGMVTIGNMMQSERDETSSIRGPFLSDHAEELDKKTRSRLTSNLMYMMNNGVMSTGRIY